MTVTIPLLGIDVVLSWWKAWGFLGVGLFSGRWLVQMHASRKAGRVVIPRIYWYMSMSGSLILLSYFVFSPKQDAVGVLANLFPAFVAGYNLSLDLAHKKKENACL